MRSHLGDSRAQVERGSVVEQKLTVRSVTTGCALVLPTSILEGLDNVAILVGEKETPRSSRALRKTSETSFMSADIAHALVYVGHVAPGGEKQLKSRG